MEVLATNIEEYSRRVNEWRFVAGETPLSAFHYQVIAISLYLTVTYTLQRVMAHRKPLEIPKFLFFHNITLSLASFVLGTWLTYRLIYRYVTELTLHELVCSRSIYEDGHMQMIYYINMFFKVWEFLDTWLLAIRKKPIAFLHAYHHAATLFLTWAQQSEHSGCQWVPIVINLWVHVLMYYYYAMSALRIRVWWKKYLTKLQILQFVTDVSIVGYAYTIFIINGFDPNACYGTSRGAIIGLSILFSYLLLFIRFYVSTYIRKPKAEAKKQ